jgi:photosystem II stability/assembly factor-like uncharacterized protein
MRTPVFVLVALLLVGCSGFSEMPPFEKVQSTIVYRDSVSIRALDVLPGSVGFAGAEGLFGSVDLQSLQVRSRRMSHGGGFPEFRAVAHTATDFFMLSAGDPALLFKTGDSGDMELVYTESGPGVFYDSMAFWDDLNGIAIGDAVDGCLSVLLTRDGGDRWTKVPCGDLPEALEGEGAFAASDTNIALWGDSCWVVSNKGRVYFSPDRGSRWELQQSPVRSPSEAFGLYTLDFYDGLTGYAAGGDYTEPDVNTGNKMSTSDGGATWELRASGSAPGYLSCVQFVPGRDGRDLVGVSFKGVFYSSDFGQSWKMLSEEGFYSLRFTSGSRAVASGNGRIALLEFN